MDILEIGKDVYLSEVDAMYDFPDSHITIKCKSYDEKIIYTDLKMTRSINGDQYFTNGYVTVVLKKGTKL